MKGEEEGLEPMSPSAQYLKSSALSLTICGVLESENEIDDSMTMSLLKDIFLPINPRFSSIMVTNKKGQRKWKKVEVNLEEHVILPTFPSGMSVDYYDECFNEYLSKIATEQLPLERPLWEIHIVKYPTKNAAGNAIFKLHHSLGDGYSLMGALLSCLQRADDPSVPLTFPSAGTRIRRKNFLQRIPRFFTGLVHTAHDFGWSLFKSTLIKDDKSPIRSGVDGVEFRPIVTTTTAFYIDQLKQIKSKLNVTINDVITGVIILGTRLYMQKADEESIKSKTTALVLLNTRAIGGYKSVDEMIKPNSDSPWGNRFAFLQVPLPKLTRDELFNPLGFVKKAHRMIKRQKNSAAVYLTGQLLRFITMVKGHEATARHIHGTLKNTSMAISNLVGPVEQMALANNLCKGLYFVVAGPPQSLSVTMISYVGKLRIALTVEKGFIDQNKLKSCIEYAFEIIYKAALEA
ncbi:wax ester synthase/diacylglycerol acyltransferase 4-like [Salvia hispanica]|uniref:wax ester synthase/diacylglycerol acyltransferase 4-like n=1 Tax=Salvia hispanica TaxID=49212 RepID=UPI0020091228|nr:wax ester synthase/diacylglycerol acyltransferase 4-like [Salvia hispanica]